ncbi:unnamed protein product [Polarella glacialis]|uniref:Protein kinase domain-containing protein n=1 Tax=Polarella glacialis TaxID=89957 RepID=A0A813KQT8_POLGL|nr:unnamed protein product [Polarella glacialis]CAE8710759.1 unnamed protein product [Polarella glacialis]
MGLESAGPCQKGPALPNIWLHSVHQQGAESGAARQPCRWCPLPSGASTPQSRELAIRTLVERAATGTELSTAQANSSVSPRTAHFEVTLGNSDLLITSTSESSLCLPLSMLRVQLLFSDVMWTSMPLVGESVHDGSTMHNPVSPHYIVAVVPHQDEHSCGVAAEGDRNTEPVSAAHGLPFQEAWLLCVGACSQSDFKGFLCELGYRGAIRWDLEKCYHLDRELESGTMSTVYLGQSFPHFEGRSMISPVSNSADAQAATQVAVKRLKVHARLTPTVVKSEIDFLVQCRGHPNITQLYGMFCSCSGSCRESSGASEQSDPASSSQLCWSIVTDFFPTGDLHDYLGRRGPLTQSDGMEIFCGVMSALAHLHYRRVTHRDVKAENILLSDKGQAILADFGSAAHIDDHLAMKENSGSPGYAAPEVVDDRPYGVMADVFSAGVVLYFALSSELPFPGDVLARIRRTSRCKVRFGTSIFGHLSGDVLALLRALLEKNPQLRPSSGSCFETSWLCLQAEVQHRSRATLVAYMTLVPDSAERLQQQDQNPQEQQQEHLIPSMDSPIHRDFTRLQIRSSSSSDILSPTSSSSEPGSPRSPRSPSSPRRTWRRKEDVFSPRSCREQKSLVSRLLDTVEEARLPHWAGTLQENVHAEEKEEEGTLQVQGNTDDVRLVPVPPAGPLTPNRFLRRLSLSPFFPAPG